MTLDEAFADHAFRCRSRTLRAFLRFVVRNFANDNLPGLA
jgi:hypothetical protein